MEKEIAIYGGAFNPPTLAHQTVIQKVLTTTDVQKIILTPDGDRLDKNFGITHLDRKKLINIFYQKLLKMGLNIEYCDYFLEGKNKSNTTTMGVNKYFTDKFGFSPWHIFGIDVAKDMPKWSGNKERFIEQDLKKIFIPRAGYEFQKEELNNYVILELDFMTNISSTMAREMIKNKQKTNGILFSEIRKYIDENNLYV